MASEAESPTLREVVDAVRDLTQVMHASRLTKIDVQIGAVTITLRAGTPAADGEPSVPVTVVEVSPTIDQPADLDEHVVTAPMIGTFYTSAAPGDPPLVRPGEHVEAGQTIGIIEAMKIMNEIPADRAGIVVEMLATNAQAVEYGSPLVRLLPSGSDE